MRDPLPLLLRFPEADILTSSDHLANTVTDEGLENFHLGIGAANIGIMFVRKAALPLVDEWNRVLDADEKVWDQNAFNDLFRRGAGSSEGESRLFKAYDGKLRMGILPVATFASGHTFFVQRMAAKLKLQPYVVHATFQFSGTDGKRHRLREALLWDVDPPEYFDPPGGFLAYTADVPQALLAASNSLDGHFALVNHQIAQTRDALALAQALGRTLIMPKMYCGWDRWWAPHNGRIPFSNTDLPFLCPMVRLQPYCCRVWGLTPAPLSRITSLTPKCGRARSRRRSLDLTLASGSTVSWTTRACRRRCATLLCK